MGLLLILLFILPLLNVMSEIGYWLIPGMIYLIGLSQLYGKGYISQGPRLEFCLETVFYLIAGLSWLGIQ
jgi:hypothetical protein